MIVGYDSLSAEPNEDEIDEYASFMEVDLQQYPAARDILIRGLRTPLPKDWMALSQNGKDVFYYNSATKQKQWQHPIDVLVKAEIDQLKTKPAGKPQLAAIQNGLTSDFQSISIVSDDFIDKKHMENSPSVQHLYSEKPVISQPTGAAKQQTTASKTNDHQLLEQQDEFNQQQQKLTSNFNAQYEKLLAQVLSVQQSDFQTVKEYLTYNLSSLKEQFNKDIQEILGFQNNFMNTVIQSYHSDNLVSKKIDLSQDIVQYQKLNEQKIRLQIEIQNIQQQIIELQISESEKLIELSKLQQSVENLDKQVIEYKTIVSSFENEKNDFLNQLNSSINQSDDQSQYTLVSPFVLSFIEVLPEYSQNIMLEILNDTLFKIQTLQTKQTENTSFYSRQTSTNIINQKNYEQYILLKQKYSEQIYKLESQLKSIDYYIQLIIKSFNHSNKLVTLLGEIANQSTIDFREVPIYFNCQRDQLDINRQKFYNLLTNSEYEQIISLIEILCVNRDKIQIEDNCQCKDQGTQTTKILIVKEQNNQTDWRKLVSQQLKNYY